MLPNNNFDNPPSHFLNYFFQITFWSSFLECCLSVSNIYLLLVRLLFWLCSLKMWFNKVSDLFTRAFFEQETKGLTKLISIQTQPVVIALAFHLKQQPTKNWTAFTWKTSLKWTRQTFAFLCALKKNSLWQMTFFDDALILKVIWLWLIAHLSWTQQ